MKSKWIGMPGVCCCNWEAPVLPAPYFRRVFNTAAFQKAELMICGLGWYELFLNGTKVGDREMDPVVSIFDKHVRSVRYDLTGLLKSGVNVFGVILGNGWYNVSEKDGWNFKKAVWKDFPKLHFELRVDDELVLVSDESWKVLMDGPIRSNALRIGEDYDARKEPGNWLDPDFDDSAWVNAARVHSPGGVMTEMTSEPCRVLETLPMKPIARNKAIWDSGVNLAGRVRLTVQGKAGAKVTMVHGEKLFRWGDDLDNGAISPFYKDRFQTATYTLKGEGVEVWEPRFTYYGFQYCKVTVEGDAEIINLEARRIGTDLKTAGNLSIEQPDLARLMQLTRNSYISNFVGIPTDCPHREKNGWTGDAQLACDTGLFLYDGAAAYITWLEVMADCQRPSGQFPGIAPSSGGCYNWWTGPAWDSAIFVIPEAIYRFTGNDEAIRKFYPEMCRYIEYCLAMADDYIIHFGLGDWCPADPDAMPSSILTDTGYFAYDAKMLAGFARMLGKMDDAEKYEDICNKVRAAFRKKFRNGAADWGSGMMVDLAASVYFGMTEPEETAAICAELDKQLKEDYYRLSFGILGAKFVPRVLADHGYVDTAYAIFTQPAYPGYVDWVRHNATSLWENAPGTASRNHIMFGDIYAWFMAYPGGFRPQAGKLMIQPVMPSNMPVFKAAWHGAETRWDGEKYSVTLPEGVSAEVVLPDGSRRMQTGGTADYVWNKN